MKVRGERPGVRDEADDFWRAIHRFERADPKKSGPPIPDGAKQIDK
jgi:hypothetical protein